MKRLSRLLDPPSSQAKDIGWEVLGDLISLLETVKVLLGGLPFEGAVGGLTELLKVFEMKHTNTERFRGLVHEISHLWEAVLIPVLDAKTSGLPVSDAMQNRLERLKANLEDILHGLRKYQGRSHLRQLLGNREATEALTDASRKITAAVNDCLLGGSIWMQVQLGDMQDQRYLASLSRLPRVSEAQYNSAARTFASGCLKGTREALLEQIYTWTADPTAKPIFWLVGLAGTGKSTIAQTVAEYMDQHHILGGSFFFSRREANRSSPSLVFPTLAYQLGCFDSAFGSQIAKSLRVNPDAGTKSLHHQLQKLIVEPLQNIAPRSDPVGIVIDALDEGGEGADVILPLLAPWLSVAPFPVRIFVTSRAEPKIRTSFSSSLMQPLSCSFELHKIEESIVQADIEYYLHYELKQVTNEMLGGASWPSSRELIELTHRAKALFIYAATAVKFIRNDQWSDPEHQLNVLLLGNSGNGSSPFHEIDELYLSVLHAAITDVNDTELAARYQQVVGTIILLHDILPVVSLAALLGIKPNVVFSAVAKLHPVFIIPNGPERRNGSIQVLHPSFPEFLTDPTRCHDTFFFINKERHHSNIAYHCLKHMLVYLKRDICNIKDFSKLNSEVEDLQDTIQDHIPADLQYACLHWAYHLSQTCLLDQPLETRLLQQLKEFCTQKLLNWLEVLSLLNHLDTAIFSITLTRQRCGMDPSLSLILYDAHRFVLEFFYPISSSAMHIYISALSFTPDCTLHKIYVRECDSSVRVVKGQAKMWHPCEHIIEGHSDLLNSVAISSDGTCIISGSRDGSIRIWSATTGASLAILEGISGWENSIKSVAFSPDNSQIVSGSSDDTIQIWDVTTGVHLKTLTGHQNMVNSVAFSPDGVYIVSGSNDMTIKLWNARTGDHISTLEGHSRAVNSVTFSPSSEHILSGSRDKSICIWDTATGAHVITLEGHSGWATSVAFSPDGNHIVSGSSDTTVRLWDIATNTPVATLEGHEKEVNCVAFSPNGACIVSGSDDHNLRLWDAVTGSCLSILEGHSDWVKSITFSPDSTHIISGSDDGTIRIWDTAVSTSVPGRHRDPITIMTLSAGGNPVVSGTCNGLVHIWDTASGDLLATLEGHSGSINSLVLTLDSAHIASGAEDCTIRVWDVTTGSLLAILQGHSRYIKSVAFSPDSAYVGSGSDDGTVRLWDANSGAALATFEGHWNSVTSVAFSPDSTQIISGSLDHTVKIWDVMSGTLVATLREHLDWITGVSFSPCGAYILCEDDLGTISCWDTSTGTYIKTATPDTNLVQHKFIADFLAPTQLTADGWIVDAGKRRLCWVPAAYRPRRHIYRSHFAYQCNYCVILGDGEFIILDLSSVPK